LEAYEAKYKNEPDREMCDHLDDLDGKDLKSGGWNCIPIDNVDHDFVTSLLDRYLKDLKTRMVDHSEKESGFAKSIRKAVRIKDS